MSRRRQRWEVVRRPMPMKVAEAELPFDCTATSGARMPCTASHALSAHDDPGPLPYSQLKWKP